ncbi:hypothetical protein [Acinetobacter baumannii]|uniref:hypothetical protein n=1 Tax=Acinetobacter baumannii TaxID=470 RepID=UPI00244B67E7|nr:hypothetical protein [Acinetobacter baumannii]MDH2488091.1 hypothetical protein [Acinetobacter baumannii]
MDINSEYRTNDSKKITLIWGAILFFGKDEVELSAYARWVLLRFIWLFGEEESRDSLELLANKIGVQHKKLRTVFKELEQFGVVSTSYPEQGQRARVKHIQLNLRYFESEISSGKNLYEYMDNKNLKRLLRRMPLFLLILRIIKSSSEIIISHKQKKTTTNSNADFKGFLVLICLLCHSDECGIVLMCGIPRIERWTGLTKAAIYRCIEQLKKAGFIRSHVSGTINNSFIKSNAPIYSLNLSHIFWKENARHGKFYVIQYPAQHLLEVKKIEWLFSEFRKGEKYLAELIMSIKSYDKNDLNQWVIQEFYEHFSALVSLRGEKSELTKFYKSLQKKHTTEVKNNRLDNLIDLSANLTFFQCLLEQWCCQIYMQKASIIKGLAYPNSFSIEERDFASIMNFKSYLHPYLLWFPWNRGLSQADQKTDQKTHDKTEDKIAHKTDDLSVMRLFISLINLIAYNQLYFFLRSELFSDRAMKKGEHSFLQAMNQPSHAPFRILPRRAENTNTSCFFVLDSEATQDYFYLIELTSFSGSINLNFPEISPPQQIQPNVEDLKKFGILDPSFQQMGDFE